MRNKRINKNRIIILGSTIAIVSIMGFGVVKKTFAYIDNQNKIKIEQERVAEEKRKAEEEKKKYMVGVNHEGKKDSYDARKISEKLNSYDYTNEGEKVVFLTFDDGASTTVTPEVLRVLKEEDVKATFFVTGQTIDRGGEEARDLVKQTFEEGHAIANHSYSHDYKKLYPNRVLDLEAFKEDFAKTDKILKDILGKYFSTRVIRCPGGQMSWQGMDELDTYLEENNMASIDWNALNADAQGHKKSAKELEEYAIETSRDKEMVVLLMHDTYGKEETAKALPGIIKYYKDNGYKFKTLS